MSAMSLSTIVVNNVNCQPCQFSTMSMCNNCTVVWSNLSESIKQYILTDLVTKCRRIVATTSPFRPCNTWCLSWKPTFKNLILRIYYSDNKTLNMWLRKLLLSPVLRISLVFSPILISDDFVFTETVYMALGRIPRRDGLV